MKRIALALVCVAALTGVARADDDEVRTRKLSFAEKGEFMSVAVSITDVFTYSLLIGLDSGFETTLVLRAYVYPDKQNALPLAQAYATVRIVYDLWEERYLVRVIDARGQREYTVKSRADALKKATVLTELPVGKLADIPIDKVCFVGLIVEVNPVSPELLGEVRKWLARDAGHAKVEGDSSFFGSFVSIFVNPKIPVADRVLKLRSQPFYRVKR